MSSSEGNILDDATAIETLDDSKRLSNTIEEKQKDARVTEVRIDEARKGKYIKIKPRQCILEIYFKILFANKAVKSIWYFDFGQKNFQIFLTFVF